MGKALTLLSFGAGQDSTYILYRIVLERYFRVKYVNGDFVVVMSDTGNEHPHTYKHVDFIKEFCKQHNIEFYFLSRSQYHPKTWKSLDDQFKRNSCIMSLAGPRTCTDNLKIKPIYNFVDHYVAKKYYGYTSDIRPKGKEFIKRFARENGKINVLIGIAAGEESRITKATKRELKARQFDAFRKKRNPIPVWFRMGINKIYPLIEEGIARWQIHDYILNQTTLPLPFPSNCMKCPYLAKIELLWLHRFHPEMYQDWVLDEKKKIEKCRNNGKKNLGIKGEKMLNEVLQEAIKESGHMTDDELNEYKMSHGHCVMSKY